MTVKPDEWEGLEALERVTAFVDRWTARMGFGAMTGDTIYAVEVHGFDGDAELRCSDLARLIAAVRSGKDEGSLPPAAPSSVPTCSDDITRLAFVHGYESGYSDADANMDYRVNEEFARWKSANPTEPVEAAVVGWQPMADAPRDQTLIVVIDRHFNAQTVWWDANCYADYGPRGWIKKSGYPIDCVESAFIGWTPAPDAKEPDQ